MSNRERETLEVLLKEASLKKFSEKIGTEQKKRLSIIADSACTAKNKENYILNVPKFDFVGEIRNNIGVLKK